jgi:hypothetical protein
MTRKKPERNVESIVGDILLPRLYFEDVMGEFEPREDSYLPKPEFKQKNFELFYGGTFEDYTKRVRDFVSARKRNYNGFRDFLEQNSEVYYTKEIFKLSNKQIDSIFNLILEYEGEAILKKCGL